MFFVCIIKTPLIDYSEQLVRISSIGAVSKAKEEERYGSKNYVSGLKVSKERKDNPDVLLPPKMNGYSYFDTFNKYYVIEKTKNGEYRYASTGSLALHKRENEYELEWWSGRTNIPNQSIEVKPEYNEYYQDSIEHPWKDKDANYIMRWLNYWTTGEFSIVYSENIKEYVDSLNQAGIF